MLTYNVGTNCFPPHSDMPVVVVLLGAGCKVGLACDQTFTQDFPSFISDSHKSRNTLIPASWGWL